MKAAIMAAASGAFGAVCRLFVWRERGAFARAGIERFLAGAKEGGGGGARRRRAEDVGQVGVCNWMIFFFLGEILLMSDSEGKQVGGKRRFNEGIVSRSPEGAPLTVSGVESSLSMERSTGGTPPPLSAAGIIVMQCSAVTRTLRSLGRRKGLGTGARARTLPPSLSDSGPPSCLLRFCLRCRLAAGGKCLALRLPYLRRVDINEYYLFTKCET